MTSVNNRQLFAGYRLMGDCMEDKNAPGHLEADEDSPEDEEILELTDALDDESEPEADFIELTDVAETPLQDEEEVLELTDVVDTPSLDDEEILELTDVAEQSSDDRANVIELAGAISDVSAKQETAPEPDDDGWDHNTLDLEDIIDEDIENTASIDDDIANSLGVDLDPDEMEEDGLFIEKDVMEEVDTLDGGDPEVDAGVSAEMDPEVGDRSPEKPEMQDVAEEAVSFPIEQIEEALERVIERMYSEKIEGIIVEAIEKAVQKEIEKINILLKDVIGNDN